MGNLSNSRAAFEMSDTEDAVGAVAGGDDDEMPDGNYLALVLQRIIENGQMGINGSGNIERIFQRELSKIKDKPCLYKLERNSIYRNIKQTSGYKSDNTKLDSNWSVLKMLECREHGMSNENAGFSSPQKCKITNNYLPNQSETIAQLQSKIYCGTFSRNGKYFVTASQDHILCVYDSTTPMYTRVNRIPAKDINWCILDIDFSPCNEYFVYCTWSACLHILRVSGSFEELKSLPLHTDIPRFCVFSVAFSSCGKRIISGAGDGCIYIFNRELNRRTHQVAVSLKENGSLNANIDVNTVGYLDDASNIIYGGLDDGLIKIYDLRCINDDEKSPEPVGLFVGHYDGITYIDSKNDGRYLISNSKDQSIKLWDMRVFSRKGSEKSVIQARKLNQRNWDYRFDEAPQQLYSSSNFMQDDVSVMTYRGHIVVRTLIRAKFSPLETTGQRYIYTGCGSGRLVIYDVLTGKMVKAIKAHTEIVRDVAWHPSRSEILTSSWDTTVSLNTYAESFPKGKRLRCFGITPELRRSRRIALRQANMTN